MPHKDHEHPLLQNEPRDWAAAGVLVALSALVSVLVAVPSLRDHVQRLDDGFLRTMASHRTGWLTAIGKVFDVLGSVKVTLPVRILAAAYLAFRRRWWHLAAFASAVVLAEVVTHVLKASVGRIRPAHPLVHVTGSSFPSGHAVATAVTAVALVIAFLPTGRQRAIWGTVAAVFAFLMALSRAYLAAHWLSDAVAGTLIGVCCALLPALVVEEIRERREAPRPGDRSPPAVPPDGVGGPDSGRM
ncbi:MAG: phosphatase PAP2 family protein [Actinomycetota bacterium]